MTTCQIPLVTLKLLVPQCTVNGRRCPSPLQGLFTIDQLTHFVSGRAIHLVSSGFKNCRHLVSGVSRSYMTMVFYAIWQITSRCAIVGFRFYSRTRCGAPPCNYAVPLGMITMALIAIVNLYRPGVRYYTNSQHVWGVCYFPSPLVSFVWSKHVSLLLGPTRRWAHVFQPCKSGNEFGDSFLQHSIIAKMAW